MYRCTLYYVRSSFCPHCTLLLSSLRCRNARDMYHRDNLHIVEAQRLGSYLLRHLSNLTISQDLDLQLDAQPDPRLSEPVESTRARCISSRETSCDIVRRLIPIASAGSSITVNNDSCRSLHFRVTCGPKSRCFSWAISRTNLPL